MDLIPRISQARGRDIAQTANLQILKQPYSSSYQCVAFNIRKPPFDNLKLRQALTTAINRDVIHQNIWFGTGEVGL